VSAIFFWFKVNGNFRFIIPKWWLFPEKCKLQRGTLCAKGTGGVEIGHRSCRLCTATYCAGVAIDELSGLNLCALLIITKNFVAFITACRRIIRQYIKTAHCSSFPNPYVISPSFVFISTPRLAANVSFVPAVTSSSLNCFEVVQNKGPILSGKKK
jgi:hypothetical protein